MAIPRTSGFENTCAEIIIGTYEMHKNRARQDMHGSTAELQDVRSR
jgi:hypothetical protein